MHHLTHMPAPVFEDYGCAVRLAGWVCLRCSLLLRRSRDLSSQMPFVLGQRKIHVFLSSADSTSRGARA
jgi:hypothetical protein